MNIISFPHLGITLKINPAAFFIGSKPIYWYAIIILTGFFAGLLFVQKTCEKRGVTHDTIWDIAIFGLIAGIAGARIYYVLFSLDEIHSFWDVFKIWNGGIAIYGGIIGSALSSFIYCRKKKLNTLKVFDVCAPGLLIGQAIGRFGNFVNAEVYGGKTSSVLGMSINGQAPVHPLFLYEAVWNVIGLTIILLFRDKKKTDGQVFFFYIFWYALGRLFLEGMRNSEFILYVIPNVLGISQLVSALFIIASAGAFVFISSRKKQQRDI